MKESYKLTQQQYDYIVEHCDATLVKYQSDISVVGIAWLHVLNSHPANQLKYIYVFNPRPFWHSVKQFIYRSAVLIADLFLSIFSFPKKKICIEPGTNLLFISHLISAKTKRSDPDFYFRDLPDHLQQQGYHTAVALLNHTKDFTGWTDEDNNHVSKKIIIPKRLSFKKELVLLARSLKTAFFFLKQSFLEKDALKRSFLSELSANVFSPDTIRAFKIYETIKTLIERSGIHSVVLTWEGHSWERLICYAAKHTGKKINTIAYQHTILFPSSHALKRSIGIDYDPDIILTVGAVTKKIIESSPGFNSVKVLEYGSPRLVKRNIYSGDDRLQNACLVAPEGLINECIILFVFGVETAKLMPRTTFIFRTHPVMSFEEVQSKDNRLQQLPSNVIVSSYEKIEDDFKRCSWLLYRSSSVSFFGILAGLRPVYLQLKEELSIDPLYLLRSWRLIVNNPDQLVSIINNDKNSSAEERSHERKEAVVFSETYMIPYDKQLFEKILEQDKIND